MNKPFNLDLALKGHPVVTRDGKHPARIVCTDVKGKYPLLVLLEDVEYDEEWPERYTLDGKPFFNLSVNTSPELVMADTAVKISDEIKQALVTLGYHHVAINSEGHVVAFIEKPVMQYLPTERDAPDEWMYSNPPSCSLSVRPMEITHLTGNIKYVTVEDSLIDLL